MNQFHYVPSVSQKTAHKIDVNFLCLRMFQKVKCVVSAYMVVLWDTLKTKPMV
jgi:hypothetical protein